MDILILSDSSQKQFVEAAEKLGHRAVVVPVSVFSVGLSTRKGYDKLYISHEEFAYYIGHDDFVIETVLCRGGMKSKHALAVLRHLSENMGVNCSHTPDFIQTASNQLITLQKLSAAKIPIPETRFISGGDGLTLAAQELKLPLIVKTTVGSQGTGVFKITDEESLMWCFRAFQGTQTEIILQKTIVTAKDSEDANDIRLWCIGGKFHAAMKRYALAGDFRANASLSGRCEFYTPTSEQIELAESAAVAVGAVDSIVGVDIMTDLDGNSYVIEVNSNPGTTYITQAIEKAKKPNLDIFCAVINFVARKKQKRKLTVKNKIDLNVMDLLKQINTTNYNMVKKNVELF